MCVSLQTRAGTETISYTATFDTSALKVTDIEAGGDTFSQIEWEGDFVPTAEPGEPLLPVKYIRFLVPVYTGRFNVEITSAGNTTSFSLNHAVIPGQAPVRLDMNEDEIVFNQPSADSYSRVHGLSAKVINDHFVDGCNHIVTVAVQPVNYNPVDNSLEAYDSVGLKLTYSDVDESELTSKPLFPAKPSRYLDLENLVVNYSPKKKAASQTTNYAMTDMLYLIVSREFLLPSFETLAAWKKQQGFNVILKSIESILSDENYNIKGDEISGICDDAGILRAYLQDMYEQNGEFYLLLGGDSETNFPIRTVYILTKRSGYEYDTDTYFSNLTFKLDTSTSIPTYPEDAIFYPDIHVGRLLCRTPQGVRNYIDKVCIYEGNPGLGDASYLDRAFTFGQDDHITFTKEISTFYKKINTLCSTSDLSLVQGSNYYGLTPNLYHTCGNDLVNFMNNHYGLMFWCGHGNPASIICRSVNSGYALTSHHKYKNSEHHTIEESNNSIDKINNYGYPSIVMTNSCTTTPFRKDMYYKTDRYNIEHNFGESFLTANRHGGVIYIGGSNAMVCCDTPSLNYNANILNLFKQNNESLYSLSIGLAFGIAKAKVSNIVKRFTNVIGYNLLGDPTINPWYGEPIKVNCSKTYYSNGALGINTTQGMNVVVYDGENIVDSYEGLGGYIYIPNIKNKTVFIWKKNEIPEIIYTPAKDTYTDCTKRFVLVDGYVGTTSASESLTIGANAKYYIKSVGNLSINPGFKVSNQGYAEIECSNNLSLDFINIQPGGTMVIYNDKPITLKPGFKIEKGAKFSISNIYK